MLSNALHRLAHWLDPSPCRCSVSAYMHGWRARRDAELRDVVKTPDAERWARYERWLRENAA